MICYFAFRWEAEKQNPFICDGRIPQSDALFYNCLARAFAAAASVAEWFFIAALLAPWNAKPISLGSAAMKKISSFANFASRAKRAVKNILSDPNALPFPQWTIDVNSSTYCSRYPKISPTLTCACNRCTMHKWDTIGILIKMNG